MQIFELIELKKSVLSLFFDLKELFINFKDATECSSLLYCLSFSIKAKATKYLTNDDVLFEESFTINKRWKQCLLFGQQTSLLVITVEMNKTKKE